MPNIAVVLKEEIARLARKELKANTESLKKAVSTYRSEIAALKRRVQDLERQVKRGTKAAPAAREDVQSDPKYRWSATRFAANRKRLDLSAADFGKLLGVSALTVYNWESGKARPRAGNLPSIAAVRKMSKRDAAKKLDELGSE